ncbi:MAG: DNA protecting protein DprA [Spirochaetaceae bacterium 4572_59]|nr:MAG: DNA protecting protein DprA [Spirochaetaceae bacterium 4572_59]
MVDNIHVLFALHGLSYLTLEEKLKLLKEFPTEASFTKLTRYETEWFLGRRLRCRSFNMAEMLEKARRDRENMETSGIHFAVYGSQSYPPLLKEIYDPPLVLFWKGTLPPENVPVLSVVGTRKPSLEADRSAFSLGMDAVRGDIPLVSGMAAGIDGAAHKGALALHGRTWAVLGTGCDRPYPSSHRSMAADIITKGGGLISEFFPGTAPARYNFPKRNRLISGLSTHIVIVQAPRRSGALYTADYGLDQGREVFVHASGLYGNGCQGTVKLAEQGATVLNTLKDIFPHIPDPFRSMQESYGLSGGRTDDAAHFASFMLREEIKGSLVFYKGRTQIDE